MAIPVAVTTARPTPWATAVPLKTMSSRSPSAAGAGRVRASFSSGSLSPVSDASETISVAADSSRASAATVSPSASSSTSPGTSSRVGTRCWTPLRTTAAVAADIRRNASTACSARACWTWPRTALATTITAITTASYGTPTAPSTHHATSEMTIAARSR